MPHTSSSSKDSRFSDDFEHDNHPESSPRGSISIATSKDNLVNRPGTGTAPRRKPPCTVQFAEKPLTSAEPKIYRPRTKSEKAKGCAKATVRGAGAVAGGLLGCVCYMLAKACILDGGAGLSGGGSRVVVARADSNGFAHGGRRRIVTMDMAGYYGGGGGAEKPRPRSRPRTRTQTQTQTRTRTRANVPSGVRVALAHERTETETETETRTPPRTPPSRDGAHKRAQSDTPI